MNEQERAMNELLQPFNPEMNVHDAMALGEVKRLQKATEYYQQQQIAQGMNQIFNEVASEVMAEEGLPPEAFQALFYQNPQKYRKALKKGVKKVAVRTKQALTGEPQPEFRGQGQRQSQPVERSQHRERLEQVAEKYKDSHSDARMDAFLDALLPANDPIMKWHR